MLKTPITESQSTNCHGNNLRDITAPTKHKAEFPFLLISEFNTRHDYYVAFELFIHMTDC